MSRVYQKPAASTTRRPPATRAPLQPPPSHPPPPPTSTTRGARAPTRGRTMYTQPPRPERQDNEAATTNQPERTIQIG